MTETPSGVSDNQTEAQTMIQENITRNIDPTGSGNIQHRFVSPQTHWSNEIAVINVRLYRGRVRDINLNYGCGGCKAEATPVEVAQAVSQVFALVAERLEQLNKQYAEDREAA
jgi:hypothetical protein